MTRRQAATAAILALGVPGSFYVRARLRASDPAPPQPLLIIEDAKHLVTPDMAEASRGMRGRAVPPFEKPATDGRTRRLDALLRDGPLVLTFIKKGCPCSEAAQDFFNQLHAAYPTLTMLGVIDVGPDQARGWADRFHAAYPLLIDVEGDLVRDLGVENSAYVVIIDPEGRVAEHWPGYSRPMLRELGALMARATSSREKSLDFGEAPEDLYTGCPYDLPTEAAGPSSMGPAEER